MRTSLVALLSEEKLRETQSPQLRCSLQSNAPLASRGFLIPGDDLTMLVAIPKECCVDELTH